MKPLPARRLVLPVCAALLLALTRVAADEIAVATASNQLGLDLFRQLAARQPEKNLVLSPYSIENALALAYSGAAGETRTEMARVLHLPTDEAVLGSSFAQLRATLDGVALGSHHDSIEWSSANRLYGQSGYPFRASFFATARDRYAASFEPVEFRAEPERIRLRINRWVETQTRDKIRDLIPKSGVSEATRLILVNALYLKAPWATPFRAAATRPEAFHVNAATAVAVPTMTAVASFGFRAGNGFKAIALPYAGGQLQMVILLPDEPTGVAALARSLSPATIDLLARDASAALTPIRLYLPRFRVPGVTMTLSQPLRALGLKTAFNEPAGSANFDLIAPRQPDRPLFISEVFHQTYVAVDEEGTEAAAATAVAMMGGRAVGQRPAPLEIRVDRPFIFLIQHRVTGLCLFIGRVSDPR